jgi:glycosyltransferase involved in cell wall biosynthesis
MKVMIATPYFYPRVGGLENYALAIARGLHAAGWDVIVACGDITVSTVTREELPDYTIYRLPVWKVTGNTPINFGWFRMLRRIIAAERPDVINAHTPVPFMVDVVTMAAGRVPVVITYHAATLLKPSGLAMRLATHAYQIAQVITLTRARAIIAVSGYVRESLRTPLQKKTSVIPNAVEIIPASEGARSGLVFVANLAPTHMWKGLDLILESLAAHTKLYGTTPHLTVIGEGSDKARYETKARELGVDACVSFAGQLVGAERDRVVGRAAAQIVYPTTANDALPTVLLEGWVQELPVLAAAIGPMPSLIEDTNAGVLVEANNPRALAREIHDMLADPVRMASMGKAARRLVIREYNWPIQITRTAALLEDVI